MTGLAGGEGAAWGINNAGEIVGWSQGAGGRQVATLWENGQPIELAGYNSAGFLASWATAINNAGQVVGGVETTSSQVVSVLWANGNITYLGTLDGGAGRSEATDINNAGQVVGWADSSSGGYQAFVWQNGTMTDLGGSASEALAINNAGQIVGTSARHAVLWQSNGTMIDLNSLMSAKSGWVLESASGINDEGQIVGTGLYNGGTAYFELTLPSSLGALGAGLIAPSDTTLTAAPTSGQTQQLSDLLVQLPAPGLLQTITINGPGEVESSGVVFTIPNLIVNGGGNFVLAGGSITTDPVTVNANGNISGYGTLTGNLTDNGTITASGGTLTIIGNVSGSGALNITPAAALEFKGSVSATNSVSFNGSGEFSDHRFWC